VILLSFNNTIWQFVILRRQSFTPWCWVFIEWHHRRDSFE